MGISGYGKIEESDCYKTRVNAGASMQMHSYRTTLNQHTYGSAANGEIQQTYSFSNPAYQTLIRSGAYNVGGPFFTRSVRLLAGSPQLQLGGKYGFGHTGPIYPSGPVFDLARALAGGKPLSTSVWGLDSAMSRQDLNRQGTKMMLSAVPTKPAFRAADALAELIADQSLFSLPGKSILKDGKPGTAGEYLNLQFALLPTISDAQKLRKASLEAEAVMSQFLREAGRVTRRSRKMPSSVTSTTNNNDLFLVGAGGTALSAYLQRYGRSTTTQTITRDVWFEGAFKNLMSKQAGAFEKKLKAWNAVYGFTPNPKSLWEATPYSWLVDYFTNAQDFIHATWLAGVDGSVCIRGYVMCTTHVSTEYTWIGQLSVANSWVPASLSWYTTDVVKQRESARPYGIGFSGAALTGKQLSILAALGISRFAK